MAQKKRKQQRRKPGTGAIRFKRGRALPFEAAFKHADGSRFDYFATAAEAATHLDGLVAARDSTTAPLNVAKGSQTVQQFLSAWVAVKAAHVDAKTLQDYTYQCRKAIEEIGRYRLDAVDLLMADTMLASLARQGYKNVSQMRMVLKQAFDYAEDNDYIKKNPFRKSTAPRTKHRAAIALTEAQRSVLLELAAADDDGMPLLPLWHLCSRLALRRGEALGLRWADVDTELATVTIRQQRTTVGNATIVKDAPKGGDTKVRTVPLPRDLLDLLAQHRADQLHRANADPDWQLTGLIFVGAHGRPPAAITVNRRLNRLVRRSAGRLPPGLHPHDLRHTALTILALQGVPANVRKRLSGHSTAAMDEHYTSHAAIEDVRRALG